MATRCSNSRGRWRVAILSFRGVDGSYALVNKFGARRLSEKYFWGIEKDGQSPAVYEADIFGEMVCIVFGLVWGGAQAAILVEELHAVGVTTIIGFGAAGSLRDDLNIGDQIVISRAIPTDGVSRNFGDGVFHSTNKLCSYVKALQNVSGATTDTLYLETFENVARWRQLGADVVNMEVAPLYAASISLGVSVIWVGHVSDQLTEHWLSWDVDRTEMNATSSEICYNLASIVIAALQADSGSGGKL